MDAKQQQPFEVLRAARVRAGYTQESLARAIRVTSGYISQIELGRAGMRPPTCVAIARELGIDPDELWNARPTVVPYPSQLKHRPRRAAA